MVRQRRLRLEPKSVHLAEGMQLMERNVDKDGHEEAKRRIP